MMKWPILAGVTLFLAISGLIAVCVLYELTGGKIPFDYGIVMDAGSTHTQITVYKWEGQKDEGTGQVTQVDTCKVKGGIQDNANISEVGNSLLPCLNNVSQLIPSDRHSSTPLYLSATAGMRLLELEDPDKANAIIALIKCTLSQSGFAVKNVGILNGKDEGLFAWVTANFLLEKLYVEEHKPYETVGALDMGGASTQISFEIDKGDRVNNDTGINLKLYGHNHLVFSQSYLCFGSNEAMRRHHAMLVGKPSKTDVNITDPCGLTGSTLNYTANDLFNQPCTKINNIRVEEADKNVTYMFVGTGNYSQCALAISNLLNYTKCEVNYTLCFDSPHQPLSDVEYMAVSSYYYVAKYLNITNATSEEYKTKMDKYCSTPYGEALELFDSGEADYAPYFCFEAQYIYHVLINGYKFNSTTWKNIEFKEKVAGSDLGWSLGYMIDATNAIPPEKPSSPYIALPTFVVLLVLCILLLIISALFLIRLCARGSQYNYTSFPEF